eukprot:233827_1
MSSKQVKMPCGCKMEKQRVQKRLQDTFNRNQYDYEIRCPINGCYKQWDLEDVGNVIDIDEDVYLHYAEQIEKRSSAPTKACPFCNADCERNSNTQYRVHCSCSRLNVDWCWVCRQQWKFNGMSDCGNSNCYLNKNRYGNNINGNNNNNGHHVERMNVEQNNNTHQVEDMIGMNTTSNKSPFSIGQKIKAKDPSVSGGKMFYDAKVTEVKYDRVKVRYNKWPTNSYDQWIHKNQYNAYIKIEVNDVQMSNHTTKASDTSHTNDTNMIPNDKTQFVFNQSVKARNPADKSNPTFYDATIKEVKW